MKNFTTSPLQADLVIRNGTVLTMADGMPPLENATVSIVGDRIVGIASAGADAPAARAGAEIIDAGGCLVLPGLVNGHVHAAMTLLRGYADDLPLKQWLFDKIFPAEAAFMNPESVYWAASLACLEMLAAGTTCFADGYFHQDSTARAVLAAGMRAVLAQGVIDFPAPGVPDPSDNINSACRFMERWQGVSQLIRPELFCHSPLTCSAETLKAGAATARRFGTYWQIHLSETAEEVTEILRLTGKRPVFYLHEMGLLDPGMIAVHAVHLTPDEIACLAKAGTGVVHCPESNMQLAAGAAPVPSMLRQGIPVGLGTDGCSSNNNLDLLREMDMAAKLSKADSGDPVALTAEAVLRMATVEGARVLGLEHEIGTIEPGKAADIIVIDLERPHLCPVYEPCSALVYSACGADVRDTIVGGRILMRNRCFQTIDAREVMQRVIALSRGIRNCK